MIVGEELLTGVGLGGLLVTYGGAFSADELWALIVLILIISYFIGVLSNWTEPHAPWLASRTAAAG